MPPPKTQFVETDSVELVFVPVGNEAGKGGATSASGTPATFEATGMQPGNYKIAVRVQPYPDDKMQQRERMFEAFNAAFTPEKTPLTYEVTRDSSQTLTVNLEKGSVTK